jgi:SAM-dependent methyltransferase
MARTNTLVCWCGNDQLSHYSDDYLLCSQCQTLVLLKPVDENVSSGLDDKSLYGKSYWLEHQVKEFGYSDIFLRARNDLRERCLYWMRFFLKYKIPPGNTLELGSAHGGFVALLKWAGFESAGLELSPWVNEYAKQSFQIPVYLGRIENQTIEPHSLDAIIMMDVLEHFPDPVTTISYVVKLLKEDGILMIQTPMFQGGKSYEELKATNDPFLIQFKVPEHIHLFSQDSVQQLLQSCGLEKIAFERAIFSQYDMFLVASRSSLTIHTQEEIETSLLTSPGGRLILALLDKDTEANLLQEQWAAAEMDRTARLEQIHQYKEMLEDSEADRAARYEQIEQYKGWLEDSEADRAARYEQIEKYKVWLQESEQDRAARLALIQQYEARLKEVEQNNTALLSVKSEQKKNFISSTFEKLKTRITSRSGK